MALFSRLWTVNIFAEVNMKRTLLWALTLSFFFMAAIPVYSDVPGVINYQGRLLNADGAPVEDNTYEITFSIYNLDETKLWDETLMVSVVSGLFNVTLGEIEPLFEIIIGNPPPLFLGIQIGAEPELEPRTPLSSSPYSLRSLISMEAMVAHSVDENTIHDGHIIDGTIALVDLGPNGAGEGQIIKMGPSGWMIADDATGPPVPDEDWTFNGSVLSTVGEWGIARAGNVLHGIYDSTHVNLGVACTTGKAGNNNWYATVGGGRENIAGGAVSTVSGGQTNEAAGTASTVGGGLGNSAGSIGTTVAGGSGNQASGLDATVGGGNANTASGEFSIVAGGQGNFATDTFTAVGGGVSNQAAGYGATVAGGYENIASGSCSSVMGGQNNIARGDHSVIVAGGKAGADSNSAVGNWSIIGAGYGNITNGTASVIGGGLLNRTVDAYTTVAGGTNNIAEGSNSAVCGGEGNFARGHHSFIGGGGGTTVSDSNSALGNWSVIPGGRANIANGDYSFAAGQKAHALHAGCFVWADNTDTVFTSAHENEVAILATKGMRVHADNTEFGMGLENKGNGDGYRIWSNVSRGNIWGAIFAYNIGTSPGIYAYSTAGYAGYFEGDINVTGTVDKAASAYKIDHPLDPENRYLSHSTVSSPDMMNIYNGNAVLDANGEATVDLPDYFETLNRDFRYQLTSIGAPGPNLYISDEINGNQFVIAGGKPGMKVSWQVTGIRNDAYANTHRATVETDKSIEEQGYYLHPEEHGKSDEMGIIKSSDHKSKRIINSVQE
jgi:hypothetical protein